MPDPADVGNEKAFAIQQGQLLRHSGVSNKYLIAYCSGDGDELVTEEFSGTKEGRFAFMRDLGIDPVESSNWAFGQWNTKELAWVLAAGNGEMKQKLHAHLTARKQRCR